MLKESWLPRTSFDQSVIRGRKLAASGDQAGALEAFLAFYNRRAAIGQLIRRRNATVVFDLLKLGDSYQPAKDAITSIANEIEGEISRQLAGDEDISDWCTIIRHLGQFDRAWALYNKMLDQKATSAAKLACVVYAQLTAEKRYPEALDTALENARWTLEEVDPKPKTTEDQAQLFTYWLPSVYEAFEVLLAANDKQSCDALEQWAMSIAPHPSIYDGLIKAAQRAEHTDVAERLILAKAEKIKA